MSERARSATRSVLPPLLDILTSLWKTPWPTLASALAISWSLAISLGRSTEHVCQNTFCSLRVLVRHDTVVPHPPVETFCLDHSRRSGKSASAEFEEVAREVIGLHVAIKELEDEAAKDRSLIKEVSSATKRTSLPCSSRTSMLSLTSSTSWSLNTAGSRENTVGSATPSRSVLRAWMKSVRRL